MLISDHDSDDWFYYCVINTNMGLQDTTTEYKPDPEL